ncbi:hypothetical protein EFP34_15515 [Lacticaseibacillus paracasei]|nr:hypothetical protein [Lacticaseibacillus paracasei]MCT3370910.1 hypothetical protein [Lacticaseibacillus paracasei]
MVATNVNNFHHKNCLLQNDNCSIRIQIRKSISEYVFQMVLVQIFLADLILVYWVPRNEGLRA